MSKIHAAMQVAIATDPYQDDDFRGSRLSYYADAYPLASDRDLIDRLNDEHKIWLAARANDTSKLPRID